MAPKPNQSYTLEYITPSKAKAYLKMTGGNRPLRESSLEKYRREMSDKQWHTTHQGIAFDADGRFRDGHHRLTVLVELGASFWFWVCRGVQSESLVAVDEGAIRTPSNVASVFGNGEPVPPARIAVARRMLQSFRMTLPKMSNRAQLALHDKYRDAIAFSIEHCGGGGFKHACVRAVIARAWYSQKPEKLIRFCEVMRTGIPAGVQEKAALKAREYIGSKTFTGGKGSLELYAFMESCVVAFVKGNQVLKAVSEEQFPIPGDEDDNQWNLTATAPSSPAPRPKMSIGSRLTSQQMASSSQSLSMKGKS